MKQIYYTVFLAGLIVCLMAFDTADIPKTKPVIKPAVIEAAVKKDTAAIKWAEKKGPLIYSLDVDTGHFAGNYYYDYGHIENRGSAVVHFYAKNIGKYAIVILNGRASCGCNVITYPKEVILPGQVVAFTHWYDSNRIGAFTKTVYIDYNYADTHFGDVLYFKGAVEEVYKREVASWQEETFEKRFE